MKNWLYQWQGDEYNNVKNLYSKILNDVEVLPVGQELSVNLQNSPEPLLSLFGRRFTDSIKTTVSRLDDGTWELKVNKAKDKQPREIGCCGICGGD